MKRSKINAEIQATREMLRERGFHLPPFADWSPDDWRRAGSDYDRVRVNKLGWDVSDFGGDGFDRFGTVQFTIRNGNHARPELGTPYAEKIIVLKPGQRLPLHFHFSKTEDIINRGGGILVIELYNALEDDSVDRESQVTVYCDGRKVTVAPGAILELGPGESITLTPRMYHKFWAGSKGGVLLCGEVSAVNDDETDNAFAEPVSRFATIEEDEPVRFLLCNELKDA